MPCWPQAKRQRVRLRKHRLLCVADTVVKMTKAAQKEHPGLPVVCAGGRDEQRYHPRMGAESGCRRSTLCLDMYSSDNAIGVSILAAREAGIMAEVITVSALNRYVKTLPDANGSDCLTLPCAARSQTL